jgi:hypothetical protein
MLRAGLFDRALEQAHPEDAARATSMGWRHCGDEGGVFERCLDDRDLAPD